MKLLYSGLDVSILDNDPALKPFTVYEYAVMAYNQIGSVSSLWKDVKTKEAPPDNVPAPKIKVSKLLSFKLFALL